jgi:hypothetical protein
LSIILTVGAFNALVDPFGTMRLVDRAGFNHVKPTAQTRMRLVKAAEVRQIKPAAIVLGTSRSHIALRMSHPGWQASPRYNLAFDGATPEEMYAYLRHAEAVHPLKEVVLGLDTWQLGDRLSFVRPDFDPMLLYDSSFAGSGVRVALADLRTLLSLDTLAASWRTIREQDDPEPDWLAPDGQRLGDVFFHRPGEEFAVLGPTAYFRETDRQEIGFQLPIPEPKVKLRPTGRDDAPRSLEYVHRIIAFCYEHNIDLHVFITPAHAHQLEIAAMLGEWPQIEYGKRALVAMLAEEGRSHGGAAFLWDFSGYSSVTTEPLPAAGSGAEMHYYWDSSHAKEIVGDFVLDRLFGTGASGPADFGRLLDVDTIDRVLAETRDGGARYRREHPEDIAMLQEMIGKARANAGLVRTAAVR